MVPRSLVSVIVAAVALGHASPAYPKCARVLLAPQVITHGADTIPAHGGVLVGFAKTTDDAAEAFVGRDPAMNADWTLTVGRRKVRPRVEQLAPGLAVYRPGALRGARPTTITLRDGKGGRLAAFSATSRTGGVDLPAPVVIQLTSTSSAQSKGRWSGVRTTATAVVDRVPDGAAALIVYRETAGAATALTWARVGAGASPTIEVYATPGRCGTEPDGLTPPQPGDSVVLAWVDQFGRLSPRSTVVVVK